MVGNQFGFKYNSSNDIQYLFNNTKVRLEEYFIKYDLQDEDILYVQISFRLLDRKIFSGISIDKQRVENLSLIEKKATLDLITIPVITKESELGNCLPTLLDKNNIIKEVSVVIKDKKYNFIDIIVENTKYIRKIIRTL